MQLAPSPATFAATTTEADIPPGITGTETATTAGLGRYRIESLLGRGGMGSVYRAFDIARGTTVALKRLELQDSSPILNATRATAHTSLRTRGMETKLARKRAQLIALFQREYHTLAQLAHPRIIEAFEYGVDEVGPYYTMELLEGDDLSKAAPLPWRRVCEVLRDVAGALALLHSRRLLHRDISPRNVHCSIDGRTKLIDFGAMSAMGRADVLAGTPAFTAPEAVRREAIDARADLFSLGALGYFLLTERAAYSGHSFAALVEAFRVRPAPPSAYAADVPDSLDGLIMQLIDPDCRARPSSAVEVVERLNALAGLTPDPALVATQAHLAMPVLVGRQTELLAVRRRALRAMRGPGASVLVSGSSGLGRSRFIEACALEARLAGGLVLSAAPSAADGTELGVVRSLLRQLHACLGEAERRALEPPTAICASLLPNVAWRTEHVASGSEHSSPANDAGVSLHQTVREYLVRVAQRRALMIAIDDYDAIDSGSAAVIAGLAPFASTSRLVLVLACSTESLENPSAPLRLARDYSRHLPLAPLKRDETESLLSAIFGDVPNLTVLAEGLHDLSAGKPKSCMEIAQHLVDAGVVRCEAGGFTIPEALTADDLPASLDVAIGMRCARLTAQARELGAVVAVSGETPLTVEECLVLAQNAQQDGGRGALAELVQSRFVDVGDRFVKLRQPAFARVLLSSISDAHLRHLHLCVAELIGSEPARRGGAAAHYFKAGEDATGLDLLLRVTETGGMLETSLLTSYSTLIDRALVACAELKRPARQSFILRRARIQHAIHLLDPCDARELLAYLGELVRMCGLAHWHELEDVADPQVRLTQALRLAAETYEQTPMHERVLSPQEAITELAGAVVRIAGYGCSTFDLDLIEAIPSLAPLCPLSPSMEVMHWVATALRDLRASRHDAYVEGVNRVLARVEQPDRAGFSERAHLQIRVGVLYAVALTDAALGEPRALARATELEAIPTLRIGAWRVRQISHLHRGDVQQAHECRKQIEQMVIEARAPQAARGTTLETEFVCYAFTDDVLNVRRLIPELDSMAARFAGWRPLSLLARAELERMRGQLESARAIYEEALQLALPGRHMMWSYIVSAYVRVLADLGRAQEAKAVGLEALVACERHDMSILSHSVQAAVAYADEALGDYDAAIARMDTLIARYESGGCTVSGVYVGLRYEMRARLAVRVGDASAFAHNLKRCRAHFGAAPGSPLSARLTRLLSEAARAGISIERTDMTKSESSAAAAQRIRRELALCAGAAERSERALALLMGATGATAGCLCGIQDGRLVPLTSSAPAAKAPIVIAALEGYVRGYGRADAEETALVTNVAAATDDADIAVEHDGLSYYPFVLEPDGASHLIIGAIALAFPPGTRRPPPRELLKAIGNELLARGDATAMTFDERHG